MEEVPPPPTPSDLGPKTSPTSHEEGGTEEQPKAQTEAKPMPPDNEDMPEGVELVPMKDVDDEEMQFEGNIANHCLLTTNFRFFI